MTTMTTIEQIRQRMLRLITAAGSQRGAAAALGISQSHLCDILRGHRKPGPKTLEALGLEEVTSYRPTSRSA
jgi:hypothetical protein